MSSATNVALAGLTLAGLIALMLGLLSGTAIASTDESIEQECFADFHDQNGRKWRSAVYGDNDGAIDLIRCKSFVSEDFTTWLGSTDKIWCANENGVFLAKKEYCDSRADAKSFEEKEAAEAEHLRLKKGSVISHANSKTKGVEFGDPSWIGYSGLKEYVIWAATVDHQRHVALAGSSNGAWGTCWGSVATETINCAKRQCGTFSKGRRCLILDVDIENLEFSLKKLYQKHGGKKRGSRLARSETDSEPKRWTWCVNPDPEAFSKRPFYTTVEVCGKRLQFSTRAAAEAEHLRLKNQSSTEATTSSTSSKKVWCANKNGVFLAKKEYCDTRADTRSFEEKEAAEAEHLRRKNQSSTVAATTSSSSTEVWCATAVDLFKTSRSSCLAKYGKWYWNYSQAQYEHFRLKKQPSTVAASAPTQTAEAVNSELELEFWKSIRDSDNPDLFRAYLRKYPDGEFEIIADAKIRELSDTTVANVAIPNLDYGNYHALVIGNNQYQNFKDLNTPINDARTVSRILRKSYGFTVDVLENATESEMFKAIVDLRSNVGRNDNVLIYFGGHGELDRDTEEGFWIPSDARRDDPSTYIPVDRIRKQIKAMPAKHVMVVADSCFSGSLTRSTLTRALKVKPRSPEYQTELQRIIDKKSRTALTSGGLEPVLDSGGGGHSVFASALISALRDNSGILDAHELFIQVRKKVRNNSPQDPEYSPIYETGHDHGDFLFVKR